MVSDNAVLNRSDIIVIVKAKNAEGLKLYHRDSLKIYALLSVFKELVKSRRVILDRADAFTSPLFQNFLSEQAENDFWFTKGDVLNDLNSTVYLVTGITCFAVWTETKIR